MLRNQLLCGICCFIGTTAYGQFPPAAGVPGTTAIYKDSSAFVAWATTFAIEIGPQQIGASDSPPASAGMPEYCLGKSDENPSVSLGDGGSCILQFLHTLRNGPGWDFAVFENSFDGFFLELAFVEVSSDGFNFFRFPATSLTDTSGIGPFDYLDPTKLNNLAGKYQARYGTPFDLQELTGNNGLDVNSISHIKLIDVVGSVLTEYCTRDAAGRKVADPWPTPFPSSGFDLDAVGVIHDNNPAGVSAFDRPLEYRLFPQPASEHISIQFVQSLNYPAMLRMYSLSGVLVETDEIPSGNFEYTTVFQHQLTAGIYRLELEINGIKSNRLCVVN